MFCRTDFLKRLGLPSPTLLKKRRLAQDVYLRALQSFQNQPLIGVFIWSCSENIQQICRSAISLKLQSNFIEITLRHGCSAVKLLNIFKTSFPEKPLNGCFYFLFFIFFSIWIFMLFRKSASECHAKAFSLVPILDT